MEDAAAKVLALIDHSFRETWAAENARIQLRGINTSVQHGDFQQARTRVGNLRDAIRGRLQNAMKSNQEKVKADLLAALDDLDDHIARESHRSD
jgi:molecular chaperone GrpE (heat shock protein)